MSSQNMDRYHTISRRIAAGFIDLVFFMPIIVVGIIYSSVADGMVVGYLWAFCSFACWSAFSIYFHARYGATPGKSLMRCRVATVSREDNIMLRTAVTREAPWILIGLIEIFEQHWAQYQAPSIAKWISYVVNIWMAVDMLVVLVHPKSRALHDLIAGTVTVKEESA